MIGANSLLRSALMGLPLLALPTLVQAVPALLPDYEADVRDWWAVHPFNPASANYAPQIASPTHTVHLTAGQSIQNAINNLPSAGGTIKLAPGTYSSFQIVGRNNVHIIADQGATITGKSYVSVTSLALNYGDFDRAISGKGQPRDPVQWEAYKNPTRNFYFKGLTFDGLNQGTNATAIQLKRVYDVVFDDCTFQNYFKPTSGHAGNIEGHMGLNNIWVRNSTFKGGAVYATYLDGAHASGMINNTVVGPNYAAGGFLFLTNDDFSEDVNENGRLDRAEERNAKYIVTQGNTVDGRLSNVIQITGENVLATGNLVNGDINRLVGIDPRVAVQNPTVPYHFDNIHVYDNIVTGNVGEGLLRMKNTTQQELDTTWPGRLLPTSGNYTVRDNVVNVLQGKNIPSRVVQEVGPVKLLPKIADDNTLQLHGQWNPAGNNLGTLAIQAYDLRPAEGSTFTLNLAAGGVSDLVDLLAGQLDLTSINDTLALVYAPGQLAGTYTLFRFMDSGNDFGRFGTVTFNGSTLAPAGYHLVYTPTSIQLTNIPEPATAVLLMFGMTLLLKRR